MENSMTLNDFATGKIKDFLEEKFGKSVKYSIARGAGATDSYLSDIYRVGVLNCQDATTVRNFIFKIIRQSRVREEVRFIADAFVREISVYNELFKEYAQLEEQWGIADEDRFKHVQVFQTCEERGREYIIMEDLNQLGYTMVEKTSPLDEEHYTLVITALAKGHALAFALKNLKAELYNELLDRVAVKDPPTKIETYMKLSNQKAIELLDSEEDREKLTKYLKEHNERAAVLMNPENKLKNPHFTLCHADCWNNNFMFKYQTGTKTPTDVMILDWQVVSLSSPVQDIYHSMFLTTDGKFRQTNFSKIFELYYECLTKNLKMFNLPVDEVYPRKVFEEDQALFLGHGLGFAIGGLPFILCADENKLSLDDVYGEVIDHSKVVYSDLTNKRLKDVLDDVMKRI